MATDTSTVWALMFALQFLVVAEIASVWAYRRIAAQKTWVVFVPVTLLVVLFTANQVAILLPNLLSRQQPHLHLRHRHLPEEIKCPSEATTSLR